MKFSVVAVAAVSLASCNAFSITSQTRRASSSLNMVLEMPKKKISKLEGLKVSSEHLIHPLEEVGYTELTMKEIL